MRTCSVLVLLSTLISQVVCASGPSPERLCARALAILSHEEMPFNPNGWQMMVSGKKEKNVNRTLRAITESFGNSHTAEEMKRQVTSNTTTLSSDFLVGLGILTDGYLKKIRAGEISITPSPFLLNHLSTNEMVARLKQGYDSEGDSASSGSARGWAAWVVGESGVGEAQGLLEQCLSVDLSETAKAQYIIALARLNTPGIETRLVTTLTRGSKSANRWTEPFPFWLTLEQEARISFQFELSDRAAAAVGLAYLPPDSREASKTNAALKQAFSELLDPPVNNPFSKRPMTVWRGLEDTQFDATGTVENHTALHPALIFSLAKRKAPEAWDLLAGYFRAIGHHPTGHYEREDGTMVNPGLKSHAVPVALLTRALHSLDPISTVALWQEKAAEANRAYANAEKSPAGYSAGKPVWRWMYLDQHLESAARSTFSENELRTALDGFQWVPHKSHIDFQRPVTGQ
jgi:hypothetical protein